MESTITIYCKNTHAYHDVPCGISLIELKYSAAPVCAVATFAAVQEGHFLRTGRIK